MREFVGFSYSRLSKGLKRRTDLAAALLHDPPVLILDEPTSGLDVFSRASFREIIMELKSENKAVVVATHNIAEAMTLSDRVYVMNKGVITAEGEPSKLRRLINKEEVLTLRISKVREYVDTLRAKGVEARYEGNYVTVWGSGGQLLEAVVEAAKAVGLNRVDRG